MLFNIHGIISIGGLMNGAFFIDKEEGCTSRDVVNEIIKKVETNKVGHTGTLDPLATGVLVVCVGKATKLVNLLTCENKTYEAEITLGISTDTYDITGNIIEKVKVENITKDKIINTLNNFIGDLEQEVPIYSAVKVNGKKLYEYARNNENVKLPVRKIHIDSLELISEIEYVDDVVKFKIRTSVSKGTYIRALVNDIAHNLGTIGVMSSLRRTKLGNVTIDMCKKIDDLKLDDLVCVNKLLDDYKKILVNKDLKKDILNGKILQNVYQSEKIVFLDEEENVLAIYKIYDKDNSKIKPEVMLGGIK